MAGTGTSSSNALSSGGETAPARVAVTESMEWNKLDRS